jgi:hypothetical protein
MGPWRESGACERGEEAERFGELNGAGYVEERGQNDAREARVSARTLPA